VKGSLIALIAVCFSPEQTVSAQALANDIPISARCVELNQRAIAQVKDWRLSEAEVTLSSASSANSEGLDHACTGVVLSNMAAVMAGLGRLDEAIGFAERSLQAFRESYSPDDRVFLRPLAILVASRFENGDTAMGRAAFNQLQLIRIERPTDRAIFHSVAASLLDSAGKWPEAESEYRASAAAWEEAGLSESYDVAEVLNGLGALYIKQQRWDDAERILERAYAIIVQVPDATPFDRIYLLDTRGILHARLGKWKEAEEELRLALSIADEQPQMGPSALLTLLRNYSGVLRKNHRRQEAKAIDARIAALQRGAKPPAAVDVTELLEKSKLAPKPSNGKTPEKK
jgi:tetratricopeptide (TPR) repeat protein